MYSFDFTEIAGKIVCDKNKYVNSFVNTDNLISFLKEKKFVEIFGKRLKVEKFEINFPT